MQAIDDFSDFPIVSCTRIRFPPFDGGLVRLRISKEMVHVLICLIFGLVAVVYGGCRYANPAWMDAEETAPPVGQLANLTFAVSADYSPHLSESECADEVELWAKSVGASSPVMLCKTRKIGDGCLFDLDPVEGVCEQVARDHGEVDLWLVAVNEEHFKGVQYVKAPGIKRMKGLDCQREGRQEVRKCVY